MTRLARRGLLGLAVGLGLCCLGFAPARPSSPPAADAEALAELEAALLYKFSLFVGWPEDAFESEAAPILFGILGASPVQACLERRLQNRTIGGRRARVLRFDTIEGLERCHVLYLGGRPRADLAKVRERLAGAPVLLVGHRERFAHEGGMINIYERGSSLRFEIHHGRAKQAGLHISSQLLKLARIIRGDAE